MSRVPVIRAQQLEKHFDTPTGEEVAVLEGIDLDVHQGEFAAVVGPSGCGKTTLLRIIQGLDVATSGTLSFPLSHDVQGKQTSVRPRLGFVFQKASLLPWKTVEQNIRFGLSLASGRREPVTSDIDDWISDLLQLTGLEEYHNYYPYQISGGMQQRVNLGRALAIKPTALLMDEPFSALDAQTRERLQRELRRIVSELSTTVVFITHDIREAAFLADRVIVMSAQPGRLSHIVPIPHGRDRSVEFQQSEDLAVIARSIWTLMREDRAQRIRS